MNMNFLNGFHKSSSSRGSNHSRNESYTSAQVPSKILVANYSSGNGVGFKPQTFTNYDGSDPVAMHLLMENALGDSKSFEVLAPEDVDRIKRDLSGLSGRIEAAQRKLALETKVRDAAHSMGRLEKPGSGVNGMKRGSEESEEAARKCEEIGQDIWQLEKQEQSLLKTLLQHNAAVLQLTHKGYLKDKATAERNGGLDGYDDEFGDLSHYQPISLDLDDLDFGGSKVDTSQQNEVIVAIGHRVEEMTSRMRGMLRDANVPQGQLPGAPRSMQEGSGDPVNAVYNHIDHLENCLDTLQRHQVSQADSSEETFAAEEDLQNINFRLAQILGRMDAALGDTLGEPPEPSGKTLPAQIDYLSQAFVGVQQQLDKIERYDSVIGGLWNTLASPQEVDDFSLQRFSAKVQEMQVRYSGLQEHKDVLTRQIQQQRELNDTADSAKDSKISNLTDQLDATRGELENTRQETNIHLEKLTSAMEELEIAKCKISQNEQSRGLAESQALNAEKEARELVEQQLQDTKNAMAHQEQARDLAHSQALEDEKQARELLEQQLQDVNNTLAQHEQKRGLAESQALEGEKQARELFEQQLQQAKEEIATKTKEAQKADESFKELEAQFVHTQTELTIAKAELDSAHGSRAERAAERAADPAMQARIEKLESELRETIADYEMMTKATIEHEKEREQSESTIDSLRDKVENLEAQLTDEKVNALGAKSPGNVSDRGATGGTSAGIIRAEFRKMMRDMKTEHTKTLRAEQEERRKLEATIRALRKDQLQTRGAGR